MSISDADRARIAELVRKRRPASTGDLRDCGWIQTRFRESFGSGGVLGPEIGVDGHLWIMIPVSEDEATIAARGAGIRKPLGEIIPGADSSNWKLHPTFRKYSRGLFRSAAWIADVHLINSRQQIFLGCLAATSLRQFAIDLRQMIEIGYATFPAALDAYEAIP